MVKKNLVKNSFGSKKILGSTIFCVKKFFVSKNFFGHIIFGSKKIFSQKKYLGQTNFWITKFFGQKDLCPKTFCPKIFGRVYSRGRMHDHPHPTPTQKIAGLKLLWVVVILSGQQLIFRKDI